MNTDKCSIHKMYCGDGVLYGLNKTLLKINHEYMMIQYYSLEATDVEVLRWSRNGNTPTVAAFEGLQADEKAMILDYLKNLPTHAEICLGSKSFYLVHGFLGENDHDKVWTRPDLQSDNPVHGMTLIIGHTPVINMIVSRESRDMYCEDLINRGEHPRILRADGFIDIDCCCSYSEPIKTLGCLRLDDMEEFYESTLCR